LSTGQETVVARLLAGGESLHPTQPSPHLAREQSLPSTAKQADQGAGALVREHRDQLGRAFRRRRHKRLTRGGFWTNGNGNCLCKKRGVRTLRI
jgi:hypothetical protein